MACTAVRIQWSVVFTTNYECIVGDSSDLPITLEFHLTIWIRWKKANIHKKCPKTQLGVTATETDKLPTLHLDLVGDFVDIVLGTAICQDHQHFGHAPPASSGHREDSVFHMLHGSSCRSEVSGQSTTKSPVVFHKA